MAIKNKYIIPLENADAPQEQPATIVNNTDEVLGEINEIAESSESSEHVDEARLPQDQPGQEQPGTQPQDEYKPGETAPGATPDTAQQKIQAGKLNLGLILPAKNIMKGLDAALAGLLALGATKMSKQRVKSDVFKMDADQIKNASTALEECLKTINLNFNNPWHVFGLLCGGFYIGKAGEMASEIYAKRLEDEGNDVKTITKKPGAKRGPKGPRKAKVETPA